MFLDFLGQIWRLPAMMFKRILSNPMGLFVYGILSKWYVMVMLSVAIVTYYVFVGLQQAGVLDAFERTVKKGLLESQAVAQHCTPLIAKPKKMWNCIKNIKASDYKESEDARKLREALELDLKRNQAQTEAWGKTQYQDDIQNPYDE